MIRRILAAAAALSALTITTLQAQDEHEHAHTGAAPARLGRVAFPTSCGPVARPAVERGVALLHSFWYEEAARAFREAAAAESTCTMAWWGLASSYLHPMWAPPTPAELQQGTAALARARAAAAPTAREQAYVDAIGAYYDSAAALPHPRRLRRWSDGLGHLYQIAPADSEAAAFYALSLVAVANASPPDSTYALQRQALAILEPLFQQRPDHPGLAHYIIHASDAPALARSGTRAADRYALIAPSVPHARHMPSHIYIRLGMWDQAIASNVSSAAASRQYESEQRLPTWDQRLHATDYMAYAYLQQGRDAAALRLVQETDTIQRFVPEHSISAEYALAAVPARYALERGRWADAKGLTVRSGLQPGAAAVTRFARAIGAARAGDTAAARAEVAALALIDDSLQAHPLALWPAMVHAQRLAAASWLAFAAGDTTTALRLATEAADLEDHSEKSPATPGAILPARELLGDLLLQAGRPTDAWVAYDAALALQPKRSRSLAGAARAAQLAGDATAAADYRRQLRLVQAKADPGRPRG